MAPPVPPHRPRATYKTYSHLLSAGRMPSEYEIVTSRLHYYTHKGFEVDVPLKEWYRRYQEESPLRCADWDRFCDPRETTYTKYTAMQHDREVFVDGILQSIEDTGYDRRLPGEWLTTLGSVLVPLRHALHGLQMIAAYVGQMGPSGRITIAALLQSADEVRRIQRIAYRLAQIRLSHPDAGPEDDLLSRGRTEWQEGGMWQPLRELIERLLVTYDWGEALVGLNLCAKPLLDDMLMCHLPALGKRHGDYLLGEVFFSLNEDGKWHRAWTTALLVLAMQERPENRQVVQDWVDRWTRPAARAVTAFAPLFAESDGGFVPVAEALVGALSTYLAKMGLTCPIVSLAEAGVP